jgi:hypothetical protein
MFRASDFLFHLRVVELNIKFGCQPVLQRPSSPISSLISFPSYFRFFEANALARFTKNLPGYLACDENLRMIVDGPGPNSEKGPSA